jgi:hypothetical protein
LCADRKLFETAGRFKAGSPWTKPGSLKNVDLEAIDGSKISNSAIFIADPQMKSPESLELARRILEQKGTIVLTGACYPGSGAETLLREGKAVFSRYPVHMNDTGRKRLEMNNSFKICVGFHSTEYNYSHSVINF